MPLALRNGQPPAAIFIIIPATWDLAQHPLPQSWIFEGKCQYRFRISRDPASAPNYYTYITAPGNTPGRSFIGVSDNTYGSIDVLTMTTQGRVGIGTNTPYSKLEVQDKIIAGDETSTNGTTILEGRYSQSTDDVVNTLGTMHGSGAWLMGYCMRQSRVQVDT